MTRRLTGILLIVSLAAFMAACGASRAARRGEAAVRLGDWDAAVAHYTKAVQDSPDRADYKIELERAMVAASRVHLDQAKTAQAKDDLEQAILEYRRAAEFDPSNRQAAQQAIDLERTVRDRIEAARPKPAIEQMREKARRDGAVPMLNPASRAPIDLRFNNASTQDILNFIGTTTGINIMYERDFRPSTFSVQLNGLTLEEALNQILSTNQLWYKVINDRTIMIINDNAQKRQMYEEQVIRTFFISNSDPQELVQLLNSITRIQGLPIAPVIAVNKGANTITIRATRGVAEVIERIIETNDKPRAEIVVDVEILEVSRTRAKQYGLNLSQYAVGTIFSPEVSPSGGSASGGTSGGGGGTVAAAGVPAFNLNTITRGISTADFYLTVPQAVVRFLASDSQSRLIAKPQLRGREGVKLTLNLGDEIPVPSTVFTPLGLGSAGQQPLTSFSYRPVGVNIEMTPRVSYEGDILMDVQIESSTLGGNIEVGETSLPTFGSRKVTTSLRLREGESHMLAGLVREEDRRSLRGLPGIMNLPILKQLFSENDVQTAQTDIVMLLTPRIVRTHEVTAKDLAPIFIGSQQSIGLSGPPPLINPNAEPDAAPAAPTAPPAAAPGAQTMPATGPPPPGMPQAPAAAPGMPAPATSAAPGTPGAPAGLPTRLPDGTNVQPTVPPGSSPTPGMTTLPPTPPPAAPVTPAQVLVSTPGNEFRIGGGPYTVPLSIANASRASAVNIALSFDPATLRVRSVQEGSFLRQGGVEAAFSQQVDAVNGRITITITRINDQTGAAGSGLLAAVLFDAVGPGTAVLSTTGGVTAPDGTSMPVQFMPASVTVR